jgi:hypothetical protein
VSAHRSSSARRNSSWTEAVDPSAQLVVRAKTVRARDRVGNKEQAPVLPRQLPTVMTGLVAARS